MRKCPAVPAESADASCHVPDLAFVPLDAAAIQSDGSVNVARTVPLSAVAQSDGGEPVRMRMIGSVLIAVSTASSLAFLTKVEYWRAKVYSPLSAALAASSMASAIFWMFQRLSILTPFSPANAISSALVMPLTVGSS